MADKELRMVVESDRLLAEIIITLRAGFGMQPAVFNPQTGYLVIPDDSEKNKKAEKKAEKEKAKAEKKAEAEATKKEEPKA